MTLNLLSFVYSGGFTSRFSAGMLIMSLMTCSEAATVTGNADYQERIALPPNAVFEAVLSNSSIADVITTPIGQVKIENLTSVPIEFAITYDPEQIDERLNYSVRAMIWVGDRLWFTTDTHYPVLTHLNGSNVELLLKRVNNRSPKKDSLAAIFGKFPASYEGVLPCADCPGIHYELKLTADHGFYLILRYIDRDHSKHTTGQWQFSDNNARLTLLSNDEAPVYFAVVDDSTLLMLDKKGQEIDSTLNYELQRFAND